MQPRVIPPLGKPTRHTNQLDFIMKEVLKPAMRHKHAWPFMKPVDAARLDLPVCFWFPDLISEPDFAEIFLLSLKFVAPTIKFAQNCTNCTLFRVHTGYCQGISVQNIRLEM